MQFFVWNSCLSCLRSGTLNSAYWALPHLSISIHLSNSLSRSMKFFQLKITLGLALGESWPLLAQPQKNTDVYKGMLPWEGLPWANLQKLPLAKTRMSTHGSNLDWPVQQVFCARLGRSLCHGNEHHGIDPNILSSGHHKSWLFHKGCASLHSSQTAILPHVGTLNSAYWALPHLSISIHLSNQDWVVLWSSFNWR